MARSNCLLWPKPQAEPGAVELPSVAAVKITCARQSLRAVLHAARRGWAALEGSDAARIEATLSHWETQQPLAAHSDSRHVAQERELAHMAAPVLFGVTRFDSGSTEAKVGSDGSRCCASTYAGYYHVDGRPRWGPLRGTASEAMRDRQTMSEVCKSLPDSAAKERALKTILCSLRRDCAGALAGDLPLRGPRQLAHAAGGGGGTPTSSHKTDQILDDFFGSTDTDTEESEDETR